MTTILVVPESNLRAEAEGFIRKVYADQFGAEVRSFPHSLIALLDEEKRIVCAAGLRFAEDDFFSETYLDRPIDRLLSDAAGRPVARDAIFEVTSLSSRSPRHAANFVRQIILFGELSGFEWAFFTATDRLHLLLRRLRLPLTQLAAADPKRVERPDLWGSYYQAQPAVFAVHRRSVATTLNRYAPVEHHV